MRIFMSMSTTTPILVAFMLLACADSDANGTTSTTSGATSGSTSSTGAGGAATTGVGSSAVGVGGATAVTVGSGGSSGSDGTGGTTTTGGCSNAGAGGAGGSGGTDADASAADATVADDATAPAGSAGIVLRYADLPPIGTGTSGTSGSTGTTTGGPPIDPNTQYIILGNAPLSCGDPYASGACGKWRVTLAVPPALFKPGVLQLGCGDVFSGFSVTGPDRGGGDCYGGGGSFNQGTLEIVSITSQKVVVRLAHTMKFEVDPNGLYEAARCP
jgi:hypothetical protein